MCHFFYSLSHQCFNLRNFDAILLKNEKNVHFFENLLGSTKTYWLNVLLFEVFFSINYYVIWFMTPRKLPKTRFVDIASV